MNDDDDDDDDNDDDEDHYNIIWTHQIWALKVGLLPYKTTLFPIVIFRE